MFTVDGHKSLPRTNKRDINRHNIIVTRCLQNEVIPNETRQNELLHVPPSNSHQQCGQLKLEPKAILAV